MIPGDSAIPSLIQRKWREGKGLHANGILFADGAVILFECRKLKAGGKSLPTASAIGDSTLESILSRNPDAWVELTEMDRLDVPDMGLRLSCGEGAMGNEGYLAVSSLGNGRLEWMAFFACSNPFESVRIENGGVVAENTYEQLWRFPLDRPESLSIVSPD